PRGDPQQAGRDAGRLCTRVPQVSGGGAKQPWLSRLRADRQPGHLARRREPAALRRLHLPTLEPERIMPTFDGGHCFLTILLPINSADVVASNGLRFSHVQMVRNSLSVMPTAHQSPATDHAPCNSPFARCTRTHFARLVVLDDVIFNGRMPKNTLIEGDVTVP